MEKALVVWLHTGKHLEESISTQYDTYEQFYRELSIT